MTAGPPFDLYPVTSCNITSASQGIASQATEVEGVAASVQAAHQPALLGTLGTMQSPMATSPTSVVANAQQIAQGAVFAAGALELFSAAVETYDSGISRLNERWSQAEADNFGIFPGLASTPRELEESQAAFEAAVSAAREQLRAELREEQRQLEDTLDDAAERTSGMLGRGPNAGDLKTIESAGGFVGLVTSLPFSFARGFLFAAGGHYSLKMSANASKVVHYTSLARNRQVRLPVEVVDDAARERAGKANKVLKALGNGLGWATGISGQHEKDLREHPDMAFSERVGRDLTQAATTVVPATKVAKLLTKAPVVGPLLGGTGAGAAIDKANDGIVDLGGNAFKELNDAGPLWPLVDGHGDVPTGLDLLEEFVIPEKWK